MTRATYKNRTDDEFPERLAQLIGTGSIRAFARRADVSDTFLRQCLAGRTEPTRTKLMALAAAGDVTVEWLATGHGARQYAAIPSTAEQPAGYHTTPDPRLLDTIVAMVDVVAADATPGLSASERSTLIRAAYKSHQQYHDSSRSPDHDRTPAPE